MYLYHGSRRVAAERKITLAGATPETPRFGTSMTTSNAEMTLSCAVCSEASAVEAHSRWEKRNARAVHVPRSFYHQGAL